MGMALAAFLLGYGVEISLGMYSLNALRLLTAAPAGCSSMRCVRWTL